MVSRSLSPVPSDVEEAVDGWPTAQDLAGMQQALALFHAFNIGTSLEVSLGVM